jgi:hypothetical protein
MEEGWFTPESGIAADTSNAVYLTDFFDCKFDKRMHTQIDYDLSDMNRSQAGSHANAHISSHLKARTASSTLHTFTNVNPQTSPLDERIAFSRYTGRRARGQIYRKHQHKQLHGGLPSSTIPPDLRFTAPFMTSSLLSARTNVGVGLHRLLCCSIR